MVLIRLPYQIVLEVTSPRFAYCRKRYIVVPYEPVKGRFFSEIKTGDLKGPRLLCDCYSLQLELVVKACEDA